MHQLSECEGKQRQSSSLLICRPNAAMQSIPHRLVPCLHLRRTQECTRLPSDTHSPSTPAMCLVAHLKQLLPGLQCCLTARGPATTSHKSLVPADGGPLTPLQTKPRYTASSRSSTFKRPRPRNLAVSFVTLARTRSLYPSLAFPVPPASPRFGSTVDGPDDQVATPRAYTLHRIPEAISP
jgi:hypothetical protein